MHFDPRIGGKTPQYLNAGGLLPFTPFCIGMRWASEGDFMGEGCRNLGGKLIGEDEIERTQGGKLQPNPLYVLLFELPKSSQEFDHSS